MGNSASDSNENSFEKTEENQERIWVFTVLGKSMFDVIKPFTDVLVREKHPNEPYKIGQIVVAKKNGIKFIHRIEKILLIDNKQFMVTKGTNNQYFDEGFITEENIIGVADLSEQAFTEIEKLIKERRVERDIAYGLKNEDIQKIEAEAKIYTKNLNNKMKQILRAIIAYNLNKYKTAEIKQNLEKMNEIQLFIKDLLIIKSLKLPTTFDFLSIQRTMEVSGDSETAIANREFLQLLKDDYEKIPLKFRGEGTPRVVFYDRVVDFSKEYSNIDHWRASGAYDKGNNLIIIATNEGVRESPLGRSVIAHEMGEYVYNLKNINTFTFTYETDNVEISFNDIYIAHVDKLLLTKDDYEATNVKQLFACAFAEYYTGRFSLARRRYNIERGVKLVLDGQEVWNSEEILNWASQLGVLNDYKIIKEFLDLVLN